MQIHILENVLPQSGMLKIEFQMRSKNSLFPRHPTSSISTVSLGCDAAVSLVSLLSLLLSLLVSLLMPLLMPLLLPGLRVKARTRTRPQEASTPSTATSVAQDEGGELGASSTARSPGPGAAVAVLPAAVVVVVVVVVAEDVCAAVVASVCVVFSSSGSLSKMTKDFPLSKFSCVGGQFILPNSKHSI